MLGIYFILAGIMSLFAILGYLYGVGAALLTLVFIMISLFLVARVGDTIVNLINRVWQLFMSGGLQAFASGGDLTQVRANMAKIPPLIPSDAAAAFLLLMMIVLIVLAILAGMHPRLRRPPSLFGVLIGLVNGYLVGAFFLVIMFPSLASVLPVPFLPEPAPGAPAQPCCTSLWQQFVATVTNASTRSLALVVMFMIFAIVMTALIVNLQRRGSRRPATRDRD
jgi:hypothetical protein